MKKFWEISKKPLIIGILASILYIIDTLIAGFFVSGASFMWVTFVFWTVFFGASVKDRLKAFICAIIGFLSAIVMMLITNSFSISISTISISTLLGVFLINCLVMYFEKAEKLWLNSTSGIFVGIMLTFSGLGVKLNPLNSIKEAVIMLAIILVYGLLGLLCGFFSIYFSNKKKQDNEEKTQDKE